MASTYIKQGVNIKAVIKMVLQRSCILLIKTLTKRIKVAKINATDHYRKIEQSSRTINISNKKL
jgi:hypothetical protein